jgi:hypothetical protein
MKIGFLARTLMITERYWRHLEGRADCWWGVTQKPLYDALIKRKYTKIAHHFEQQVKDKTKTFGNQFVTLNPGVSENKVAEMIDPDIWITESLNKLNYVPKKSPWVQIFHSLPIKKHFFYPPVLDYDLMLLPGEYHKQELLKRLKLKDNDKRLKVVGWPRIDDFANQIFDRETILQDLGLDPKRKTIMYAPTWGWGYGNDSFFARWFGSEEEVFEQFCRKTQELDINAIVKLHSLSFYADHKGMMDIARKYGVLWVTKETSGYQDDPNPFLWVTDILISDLSGIIADFLILDRPIIYIDPDETLDAWDGADMPKQFRVGAVVDTPQRLLRAMEEALRSPQQYHAERQALAAKLFYCPDGHAAERAAEEIMTFADSHALLKK